MSKQATTLHSPNFDSPKKAKANDLKNTQDTDIVIENNNDDDEYTVSINNAESIFIKSNESLLRKIATTEAKTGCR